MKPHESHDTRLQRLTHADLAYIRALAAEHSEGLGERCAQYRRRASIRRAGMAACIIVGCCLSYYSAMPAPLYDQITTSSESGNHHICEAIRFTIENV